MDISIYLSGNGIDVSKERSLKINNKSFGSHRYITPSNIYTLKKFAKPESLDYIYSKDVINISKFYRVLLQEWFNFCKIGGHIIIEFKENNILDSINLLKEIKLMFEDKVKIVEDFYDKKEGILVMKKLKGALEKGDSIDKWSFGIITGGKREDLVDKEINSIKKLNIPYTQIIVCGSKKKRKNIKNIPFGENDGLSKGKNLIVKNAKYENIVVTHDKFIFDKNWFEGMKKYGNYFQVLGCIIYDENGMRAGDWITYGINWNRTARIGAMEYKDWDKYGYIDGGFYILKKAVWRKVKWNEKLGWGQGEDIELSKRWYQEGIITRFNLFSKVITLKWNHGKLREYKFDSMKLGKLKSGWLSLLKYRLKQRIKRHILRRAR